MCTSEDKKAFEQVVAIQWEDMAQVVHHVLDAPLEDAEEWLQDGLLTIWRGLVKGSLSVDPKKWRPYIVTAAINRGSEIQEKRRRRGEVLTGDLEADGGHSLEPVAPEEGPGPLESEEEAKEEAADRDRVTRAMAKLPPSEREIVLGRLGETDEALSARLGITVKSVQQVFSRASKRLGKLLGEAA